MNNCLLYALGKFMREGGYLIIRKSRFGWWPHLLHSSDLETITDFRPPAPSADRWLPPLLYRGIVRTTIAGTGSKP